MGDLSSKLVAVADAGAGEVEEVGVHCCSAGQASDQRLSEPAVEGDIVGHTERSASAAKETGRLEVHLTGVEVGVALQDNTAHSAVAEYALDSAVPKSHADMPGTEGH